MSWKLSEQLRARLTREQGSIVNDWGGKRSVALLSLSPYRIGMGNLAVHSLYALFNADPGIVCERVFLPDAEVISEHVRSRTPVLSLESQRPLHEFDWIAMTVSFENDYVNLFPIFELCRIPTIPEERNEHHPIIIAGGAAPSLNPQPLSAIVDAVLLGDAEAYARDLIPLVASSASREEVLHTLAQMEGVFMGNALEPAPRHLASLDAIRTQSVIHAPDVEFGEMHLIEVERGCPRRCTFCATPTIYGPTRRRSATAILSMVDEGISHRKRFGLIGADILSHPEFSAIANGIHERGATFSPSSIRADAVDDERARLLATSLHKSAALGVEAGSERLRKTLGKGLSDDRLFAAVETLARHGITRIRLYFMVGLPTETDDDIEAIATLACTTREVLRTAAPKASRATGVDLTVTPFVPKPKTAFAQMPFAGERTLKAKYKALTRLLARESGISLRTDSLRQASIEATIASGDRTTLLALASRMKPLFRAH